LKSADFAALTDLLWPDGDGTTRHQVYWLVDGARDPAIVGLLRSGGLEYTCLYTGDLHPQLQAAAPYLVHLAIGSSTTNRLLRTGWGKAWGILTIAAPHITLAQQRLHFKKYLRVKSEDGRELAFRFYDPRVLNIYLPTCTDQEVKAFLGPVQRVIAELPGGTSLNQFDLDGQRMRTRMVALAADSASVQADESQPGGTS
jgi:hypothetical protein